MNAPVNEAVRKALESVTLDDKQRRCLWNINTAGCVAGCSGVGVLPEQGGA